MHPHGGRPLQRSILIVDEDASRRRAIASSLSARGQRYLDVGDAFAAMAALGRADFGAVVATEGRRTLSLRGLCQLARKRHPDILLFVLPKPGSDQDAIRAVLDLPVVMLSPELSVERLVTDLLLRCLEVEDEHTRPGSTASTKEDASTVSSLNPFGDSSSSSDLDEFNAFDPGARVSLAPMGPIEIQLDSVDDGVPAHGEVPLPFDLDDPPGPKATPERVSFSVAPTPQHATEIAFDGDFEDVEGGAGAALLMGLFAQEMTGRLTVHEGEARGTLYLYRGEPVWADDPEGDAVLYRKLIQKSFLNLSEPVDPVGQGELLGWLMQRGLLTGAQMHDFMREVVRDRVIDVAVQNGGTYQFKEDRSFLDTAPLLKVNPFGLILDSRRRRLAPQALFVLGAELENKYLSPQPALSAASQKLQPFVGGHTASAVIDGLTTVKDFWAKVGLDPFMGSLVVVAMRDSKLVSVEDQPRARGLSLTDGSFEGERSLEITIADSEQPSDAATSEEESRVREDIFALYMRLKPLSQPRQVLGVELDASAVMIEAAYQKRMAELDPARIPQGSAHHLLVQRVDELRRKVTSAYQLLLVQAGSPESGTNPF